MEEKAVRWGVISRGGRFYPARDKEQAEKWAAYDYGEDDYSQSMKGTVATSDTYMLEPEHTLHRLWFRKLGAVNVNGKLTPSGYRLKSLDPTPPFFRYIEGSYAEISKEAERLNEIQVRSNYMDYLYFPEPACEEDDFVENVNLEELFLLPAYERTAA